MTAEREGAIPLAELAAIAKSVQDTVDRIARSLNDRSGRGRPPKFLAKVSALEAVGIEPGSAVLEIEAPHDMEELAMDFGEADAGVQAIEIFVESIDALSRGDTPPRDIGAPAEKSLRDFFKALENHDQVRVESAIAGTTTSAFFEPPLMLQLEEEPSDTPAIADTVEIIGRLYEVNLHRHTYRIRDDLGKTRIMTVGGDLDDRALARTLLGEVVRVTVVAEGIDGSEPDHFVAISIGRVDRPQTSDYYTWDLEKALESVEPLRSIEDLRIPGLDADEADAFWHAVND
jgi:hypothetical protein